jgi:hypothetical protein
MKNEGAGRPRQERPFFFFHEFHSLIERSNPGVFFSLDI